MSKSYTVTLTDAEDKAMQFIAVSVQEWVDNVVKSRAEVAIEEIFQKEIQRKMSAGETISGSKADVVLAAPIATAAEVAAEQEAARAAKNTQ